jgi:hypothetical protein
VSWTRLLEERRIAREGVDRAEIERYLALVALRLADAGLEELSPDGRFTAAYDTARTLAVIAIRASGYRVLVHGGGHKNTFLALRCVANERLAGEAAFLDQCRRKRNEASYLAPRIGRAEADDLFERVQEVKLVVQNWLEQEHPDLLEHG